MSEPARSILNGEDDSDPVDVLVAIADRVAEMEPTEQEGTYQDGYLACRGRVEAMLRWLAR